jgi:outer membrane lipoprotein-sorting protein
MIVRVMCLCLLAAPAALAQDAGAPAPTVVAPDPAALSRKLDRLFRSDTSRGRMRMHVKTPDFERTMELESWSAGMDKTLVRITSPRKEKGNATLKRGNEMWNYVPKIKRTIRIPPSMMMGSWMGSDLTNDDLMRESSWETDYSVQVAPAGPGEVALAYVPKPHAAVTWSKVVVVFDAATELPTRQEFYDEKGRLARRMDFDAVQTMGGRVFPTRMTLIPLLKKGRKTVIEYLDMQFDVKHPGGLFSITRLRRGR